jgi:hypothetical protein
MAVITISTFSLISMANLITYGKKESRENESCGSSFYVASMSLTETSKLWEEILKENDTEHQPASTRNETSISHAPAVNESDVYHLSERKHMSLIEYFPKITPLNNQGSHFSLKRSLASTAGKNRKAKDKSRILTRYEQLYLDLGQKGFRFETCNVCSMTYHNGMPEDRMMHHAYHKRYLDGVEMKVSVL